jgi:hypothetical protein
LKNDENVASKANKQQNLEKTNFSCHLEGH